MLDTQGTIEGYRSFLLECLPTYSTTNERLKAYLFYLKAIEALEGFDYPMSIYNEIQDIFKHPENIVCDTYYHNTVDGMTSVVSNIQGCEEEVVITVTDNTSEFFVFGYRYNSKTNEIVDILSDKLNEM